MHSKEAGNGYYHTYVQVQNLQNNNNNKNKSHHTKQYTAENVIYFSGYLILFAYCLVFGWNLQVDLADIIHKQRQQFLKPTSSFMDLHFPRRNIPIFFNIFLLGKEGIA